MKPTEKAIWAILALLSEGLSEENRDHYLAGRAFLRPLPSTSDNWFLLDRNTGNELFRWPEGQMPSPTLLALSSSYSPESAEYDDQHRAWLFCPEKFECLLMHAQSVELPDSAQAIVEKLWQAEHAQTFDLIPPNFAVVHDGAVRDSDYVWCFSASCWGIPVPSVIGKPANRCWAVARNTDETSSPV